MTRKIIISATLFFVIASGFVSTTALAATTCDSPVKCAQDGTKGVSGGGQQMRLEDAIRTISNVLLFILGAIAVIMIIIGGIRYTTSNGDAQQISSAKNTILYAVIGIAVALIAYAIVNFVLGAFSGNTGG